MSKFPWKTALAGTAILAVTGYAFAAQLSPGAGPVQPFGQMQTMPQHGVTGHADHMGPVHGQTGPHTMDGHGFGPQSGSAAMPTMPGQEAFGTIQEILRILEADPSTDWSKVNIAALREHLIDMDEVTMRAASKTRMLDGGIEFTVTGTGRTLAAIKRMVPTHTGVLRSMGWNATTEVLPNGVKLTVMASEAQPLVKLKALGFIGIMAQGANHQPHHLMMAKGEMHMAGH